MQHTQHNLRRLTTNSGPPEDLHDYPCRQSSESACHRQCRGRHFQFHPNGPSGSESGSGSSSLTIYSLPLPFRPRSLAISIDGHHIE
ncbi:hypothetical protein GALMADRAFT_266005 [Galerina marginata CBS 339.88]|uniref:Uncharacterized protein n=1 Tax=Galerina marginata (strain CBS 339.88) TaxID=685588 RepID=A0A067T5S1_GALM3|nr:hypothetical protein GALMADRAFT_266005 [Galerina marginata CBS 339.88]